VQSVIRDHLDAVIDSVEIDGEHLPVDEVLEPAFVVNGIDRVGQTLERLIELRAEIAAAKALGNLQ
jgi:hypothetical protein